ncbi:hypothetical protein FS749_000724 [Ceratobasidium sp. UAMH 11750]|nr:hypothetical protein FS749_000724 [Ceratobasidium sp. UAMH 11750]
MPDQAHRPASVPRVPAPRFPHHPTAAVAAPGPPSHRRGKGAYAGPDEVATNAIRRRNFRPQNVDESWKA